MRVSTVVVLGRALAWLSLVVPVFAEELFLKAFTFEGCFDSSDPLQDHGYNKFQSSGACQEQCVRLGKAVMAMSKGTNCWCGDRMPAADSKVDDSKCDKFCVGFDKEMCTYGTILGPPDNVLTLLRRRTKNMERIFDRRR